MKTPLQPYPPLTKCTILTPVENVPEGRDGWKMVACPVCGRECWETPLYTQAVDMGAELVACAYCASNGTWKSIREFKRVKITIQEAIDLLTEMRLSYKNHDHGERIEAARRMAIEALGRKGKI